MGVTGVSEEEELTQIDVSVLNKMTQVDEAGDPFNQKVTELKGIGSNEMRKFKRRHSNTLSKARTGKDGAGTKQLDPDFTGYAYLDVVQPPYNLDYLAKLPEMSPYHLAAIHAKQANIVGLGFRLVENNKTKRKLSTIADDKALARARNRIDAARDKYYDEIDELNPEDGLIDVLSKAWFDYESLGVGYIEIGRTPNGDIGYIGHIPATTMRVRRSRDGFVQITGNKVQFFRNYGETDYPDPVNSENSDPNEVIMLSTYSAKNSYYGMPSILSATGAIAGNEFATRYNLDYFENKAVPRHLIILKGAELSLKSKENILKFFDTGLKGQNHRSMFVPLPADTADRKVSFEIKPIEAGNQDASFEKYFKMNATQILLAHRVPPNKVGLSENISAAAALDASKNFKDQVCVPAQKMLTRKVNKIIKALAGNDVFLLEFNELTLTDEDTQSKIDERYLRNKVIVPNEVRSRMGRPGIKGGDDPIELNAQRLSEARADVGQTRSEDRDNANNTTSTNANGRNPKGSGAKEDQ